MTNTNTPNRNMAHAYGAIANAFKHLRKTMENNGVDSSSLTHVGVMEDAYLALAVKYEADANYFGEE